MVGEQHKLVVGVGIHNGEWEFALECDKSPKAAFKLRWLLKVSRGTLYCTLHRMIGHCTLYIIAQWTFAALQLRLLKAATSVEKQVLLHFSKLFVQQSLLPNNFSIKTPDNKHTFFSPSKQQQTHIFGSIYREHCTITLAGVMQRSNWILRLLQFSFGRCDNFPFRPKIWNVKD